MLEKSFNAQAVEESLYKSWEDAGCFESKIDSSKEPFCIMMPPPNVTGSLHIGHALTFTLQDVLVRYHRTQGRDVLWQPGMDHAGIATQNLVERMLDGEGVSRHDLGREKFLERVWQWKEESGGMIMNAFRRLGISPDWERERFTMDEGLSKAVREVFVTLFDQGLIYRDKRLVNWDPKLKTAISDLEVEQKESQGNYYYFKYPIENSDQFVVVATTRPETMFGDSGVAVHPDDERYKDLVGKNILLPLVSRKIPIIADEYSDPEKGTGAVKITPAHDFNDYEVGQRNNLEMINILDETAHLNENVPEKFQGMERFKARKEVVKAFEELGLLEKIEPTTHMVPYGDRGGVVIEPWLTDQWYVDAETLAQPALEAVKKGDTKFVPELWEKTYFNWLENIQPWCISRQLWWGHRIPAWYGPDGEFFVAHNEAEALEKAKVHYGRDVALTQDEDVLDTWFSSALWPFSTLDWPEESGELKQYYPTSVLVTGFDIIFFWVARMMMMGMHFMEDVPFKDVYVHALVRDEHGNKMSKSKGNVIDPRVLIDKFGADALRYTLASLSVPGQDIKLAESQVELGRNFVTKIWNAAKYCQMNEAVFGSDLSIDDVKHPLNHWILSELLKLQSQLQADYENYRFDQIADHLYHFVWGTFCDWYLEFTKPVLQGDDDAAKSEIRLVTGWVFDQILKTLHPLMPFVTEHLWQELSQRNMLMNQEIQGDLAGIDMSAAEQVSWVQSLVAHIRSLRSEVNVPPKNIIPVMMKDATEELQNWYHIHQNMIHKITRIEKIDFVDQVPEGAMQSVFGQTTILLPLADIIDAGAERARLGKELDKLATDLEKLDKRLSNPQFSQKAKPEVVAKAKKEQSDLQMKRQKLQDALKLLADT